MGMPLFSSSNYEPNHYNRISRANGIVTVMINNFEFCLNHGRECCHHCACDFRRANNLNMDLVQIPSPEPAIIPPAKVVLGDDRPSIKITDQFFIQEDEVPVCCSHDRVGCNVCFDFELKIAQMIQRCTL